MILASTRNFIRTPTGLFVGLYCLGSKKIVFARLQIKRYLIPDHNTTFSAEANYYNGTEETCELLHVAAAVCLGVNLSTTIKITIIIRSKKLEIKEPHRDA